MKISLKELLANPANSGRIKLANRQTVERYKRMAARSQAPPITIDRNGFVLDGLHRIAAAIELGRVDIESNDPLEKLRNEARALGGWENGVWF